VRIGELVISNGKPGWIIQQNGSAGAFVVDFDGSGNGPWMEPEHLTIATLKDVFNLAGFIVPDGLTLCQMFGSLYLYHDKGELFPATSGPQSVSDCYSLRETNALNGPKWGWIKDGTRGNSKLIDLSRLPAIDAWELIPDIVKSKLPSKETGSE
jgi:hypothetical protein